MALPQVVVIILLARWGLHWPSAMVAFSLAMQVVLMQRVLAAPAANAPFYNATGTTLYVLGMLTSAFGLSVIV
jgi:chlorophyll synthase